MFGAMTTPQDPFATPPANQGATPPPPPGYVAPTQPIYGATAAPVPPKALATWTIILTGLFTFLAGTSTVVAVLDFESYIAGITQQSVTPVFDPSSVISFLSSPFMLASYVVLALWMGKIRSNLKAVNRDPGGIPAVEWWGWFVPIANYVLPALGMRSITKGSANLGLLLGWWLAFCGYWAASAMNSVFLVGALDLNTGLFDADALLVTKPILLSTGAFLVISWIFLAIIVSRTTRRHLDNA